MRGERLVRVMKTLRSGDWPTFYIVTENSCYEYTGQAFEKCDPPATGFNLEVPTHYIGRKIQDVRGDGESSVMCLNNGDVIVLDLVPNVFGTKVESHLDVRFVPKDEMTEWQTEYDDMDQL